MTGYEPSATAREFFRLRSRDYARLSKWAQDPVLLAGSRQMLAGLRGNRVVDFGAGTGSLISRLDLNFAERFAVDSSHSMLEMFEDKSTPRAVADLHSLPFADKCIDLGLARQVLHYCEPGKALGEIHRVLAVNGTLHVVQLTDDLVDPDWMRYWVNLRGVKDRRRFSKEELVEAISRASFSITAISTVLTRVEHTWEDFFRKNLVSSKDQVSVKRHFTGANTDVASALRLQVGPSGLAYDRVFTFLLASAS